MVTKKSSKKTSESTKKRATKKATKKTAKKSVETVASNNSSSEKANNSKWLLITGIVVVVAVFALLTWLSQPKIDPYNQFDFIQRADGLWDVKLDINNQPYTIVFHHHPNELEDIFVQENLVYHKINQIAYQVRQTGLGEIYVAIDPKAPADLAMAFVEISKVTGELFNIYNIPTHGAYTRTSDIDDHIPVKTCADADEDTLILWIKTAEQGDNVIAEVSNNCVVLQGTNPDDTVRVADRFVYELLGIMSS